MYPNSVGYLNCNRYCIMIIFIKQFIYKCDRAALSRISSKIDRNTDIGLLFYKQQNNHNYLHRRHKPI